MALRVGLVRAAFFSYVLVLSAAPLFAAGEGGHDSLLHYPPIVFFVNSLIAAAILVILGILSTRNLQKIPGKLQNVMEMVVGGLGDFFRGILGPHGERHIPFLVTLFLFILTMNFLGLTGVFKAATATLNQTIALALVAFVYVQYQGIKVHGFGGYLKHFLGEPLWLFPLMLPLHLIGELAKPLSLSFRLFGNIFGEEVVIENIAMLSPLAIGDVVHWMPVQFPILILGVLKSVLQALVFSVLTAAYLVMMATPHEDHHQEHGMNTGHEGDGPVDATTPSPEPLAVA